MKVTIEIPEELYRQVKAKSALEGRPVREVAEELFRRFLEGGALASRSSEPSPPPSRIAGEPVPKWFGSLRKYAQRVETHDMEAIRESIARAVAAERS